MPIVRTCKVCGRQNRVPAAHLADPGRCGACKSPLPPVDGPLEVDPDLFNEVVQNARVPVLVDFWAAWCGPCRPLLTRWRELPPTWLGRGVVLKVDTERYPELATRFKLRGIPNLVVFYAGRPVTQHAEVLDHQQMENWLRAAAPAAIV